MKQYVQPRKKKPCTLLCWHHGAHLTEEARIFCMDLEKGRICTVHEAKYSSNDENAEILLTENH